VVKGEKRGSTVYYDVRVRCLPDFFDGVESVMKCSASQQQGLLSP